MPHIHTQPGQHDHTVSAYIIRYIDDVPHLLLHRHKKYRQLMQPGGHIELNETPWQAILHEIPEETGYETTQLRVLQPQAPAFVSADRTIVMPVPYLQNCHSVQDGTIENHYHDDSVYVFVTDGLPKNKPHEDESDELFWLTAEEVKAWDSDDIAFAVKKIADAVFSGCVPDWQPVDLTIYPLDL